MNRLLRNALALVREAFLRFSRHHCGIMAAATSFYALLSLVPLALLAISIFGRILSPEEAQRRVLDLIQAAVPGSSPRPFLGAIRTIASHESRWFVNSVGLFALLWAGTGLLGNLSSFLTIAWTGRTGGRTFLGRRLVALAAIAVAGLFFFLSVVFTSVMAALSSHRGQFALLLEVVSRVSKVTELLLATVVAIAMFFLLYRFLPAARVTNRAAFVGAIPAAVLWHLSRLLFRLLVASSARYGQIYGPLAGVVIFLLWVYYSGIILFYCAEIAAAYQDRFAPARSSPDQP